MREWALEAMAAPEASEGSRAAGTRLPTDPRPPWTRLRSRSTFQMVRTNKLTLLFLRLKTDFSELGMYTFLGGFNVVKFGDAIDVKGIISLVTSRLAVGTRQYRNLYAMRLHHPGSGESYWLHQDTTMYQVSSSFPRSAPISQHSDFFLRITYNIHY